MSGNVLYPSIAFQVETFFPCEGRTGGHGGDFGWKPRSVLVKVGIPRSSIHLEYEPARSRNHDRMQILSIYVDRPFFM